MLTIFHVFIFDRWFLVQFCILGDLDAVVSWVLVVCAAQYESALQCAGAANAWHAESYCRAPSDTWGHKHWGTCDLDSWKHWQLYALRPDPKVALDMSVPSPYSELIWPQQGLGIHWWRKRAFWWRWVTNSWNGRGWEELAHQQPWGSSPMSCEGVVTSEDWDQHRSLEGFCRDSQGTRTTSGLWRVYGWRNHISAPSPLSKQWAVRGFWSRWVCCDPSRSRSRWQKRGWRRCTRILRWKAEFKEAPHERSH